MAEWAIGAWLAHSHHFKMYMEQADQELWQMGLGKQVTDSVGLRMYVVQTIPSG